MNQNKKAKWIVGTVGVAFSAFVLSQFSPAQATNKTQTNLFNNEVNGGSVQNGTNSNTDPFNSDNGSAAYGDGGQGSYGDGDSGSYGGDGGSGWSFNDSQGGGGQGTGGFGSDRQSGAS
ncbi:hypothetical protein PU629_18490 [Pullulanibacillus sp. KACC 23026]|uniref:hypothetical protein n=1 Tax=Pullulanibacillus sp. KACC 23026 TaxID=3028315 RepID=UPI0023AE9FF5|nr:hypothetical protein [Pullulanibacillus sp. KACC 23026]WEG12089.1 hypothetical protein PU629_18490 [Pullulanibacillus sp. KACC 23026]